MSLFQTLRQTRAFALGIAAWFVLSIGLAVASPLVKPQAMTVVCSASGSFVVDAGNDGEAPTGHGLDCVLCLPWTVPVGTDVSIAGVLPQDRTAPESLPQIAGVFEAAAPPPARGPPAL